MFIWQNKRIKHVIIHDIGRTLKNHLLAFKSGKNDKSLLFFCFTSKSSCFVKQFKFYIAYEGM